MSEDLVVELRSEDNLAWVVLRGVVNLETSEALAERLRDFVREQGTTRFLIDARNLEYVSSAGVGVFIDLYDHYEDKGGRIAFVGLGASVRRVLELVGYMGFFGDFSDEDQARVHLRR